MKNHFSFLFLILLWSTISGQTLFFDHLNSTSWTSNTINNESEIMHTATIGLSKLKVSEDSIKQNVSFWKFRDNILTISNYDCISRSEILMGKYIFDCLTDQAILQIKFNDSVQTVFDIGITSSGSFATLIRRDDKVANFIATIDIKTATKNGIYLNGYVVHIPYSELTKLHGKKVFISGNVTLMKGPENLNDGIISQGRKGEIRHILKPIIKT